MQMITICIGANNTKASRAGRVVNSQIATRSAGMTPSNDHRHVEQDGSTVIYALLIYIQGCLVKFPSSDGDDAGHSMLGFAK